MLNRESIGLGRTEENIKKPEEKSEEVELKLEGEKIYSEDFTEKLNEVLKHEFKDGDGKPFFLKELVDGYLNKFCSQ
jgi:hypothetical protein